MLRKCGFVRGVFAFGQGIALFECPSIAVREITLGCRHEHIVTKWACTTCADPDQILLCMTCFGAGEENSHECQMRSLERKPQ